ncbi:MAG: hypothetical protein WCO84_00655 [bacterium]
MVNEELKELFKDVKKLKSFRVEELWSGHRALVFNFEENKKITIHLDGRQDADRRGLSQDLVALFTDERGENKEILRIEA